MAQTDTPAVAGGSYVRDENGKLLRQQFTQVRVINQSADDMNKLSDKQAEAASPVPAKGSK